MLHAIFLVPAVMAASFVLILFFGRRIRGGQGALGIGGHQSFTEQKGEEQTEE